MEPVGFGVRVRELRVDLRFSERLARHLEIAHKVIVFTSLVRNLDDFDEVGGILGLDVRVSRNGQSSREDKMNLNLPMESLIRKPSSWAFPSRLHTSGRLTLLA